jgi:bifunctional non-homologous end joining protein LigD
VCDVEFHDWTTDRLIRQSSFKGLREDKAPEEVVLETRPQSASVAPELSRVRLTHPERILWEAPGITKQGLAEFYADIAKWILPHMAGRVLSLVRCPSGIGGQHFYAKHPWHGLDPAVRRVDVGEKEPMLVVENLTGLLSLVQASVAEIHPWGSKADDLDRPDRLIFDLDPDEDLPWSAVIAAAREVRDRLAEMKLASFVKTSGGKGLHVVVPIVPSLDWDAAKDFTGALATAMAKDAPDRYVATMSKRARKGRVFVDFFRNGRGATAVGAYSTRALPDATVSTPLDWSELSESVRADHFRIDNLRQRLAVLKQDPWAEMFSIQQKLPLRK